MQSPEATREELPQDPQVLAVTVRVGGVVAVSVVAVSIENIAVEFNSCRVTAIGVVIEFGVAAVGDVGGVVGGGSGGVGAGTFGLGLAHSHVTLLAQSHP